MISRLIRRTNEYRALSRNASESAAAVQRLSQAMLDADMLIGILRERIAELEKEACQKHRGKRA